MQKSIDNFIADFETRILERMDLQEKAYFDQVVGYIKYNESKVNVLI